MLLIPLQKKSWLQLPNSFLKYAVVFYSIILIDYSILLHRTGLTNGFSQKKHFELFSVLNFI